MKTIQPVTIWSNGLSKQASVFNCYAINVTLNQSAMFYYALFSQNEDGSIGSQLSEGNLAMSGEAYEQWQVDSYAWDWAAQTLNLTITGEYVPPTPQPIVESNTSEEPTVWENPTPVSDVVNPSQSDSQPTDTAQPSVPEAQG